MTEKTFRSLVKELIIPEFERRGFTSVALDAEDARSPEIKTAFPFGRLRRSNAHGFDLVEIQMNKHNPESLRLNFSAVPADGIEHVAGHVAAKDVWVHYMNHYCTLYRSPFFRSWFSTRKVFSKTSMTSTIEEVIDRIVEIDDFFATGKIGPHVRKT